MITIERKADFWWVVVDGKPSYPCETKAEAEDIKARLLEHMRAIIAEIEAAP